MVPEWFGSAVPVRRTSRASDPLLFSKYEFPASRDVYCGQLPFTLSECMYTEGGYRLSEEEMPRKSKGSNAREARSQRAAKARHQTREQVRRRVLVDFCTCGRCMRGDYSSLCLSAREIARTCNTLRIPTTTGRIGAWQVTTVTRLFRGS